VRVDATAGPGLFTFRPFITTGGHLSSPQKDNPRRQYPLSFIRNDRINGVTIAGVDDPEAESIAGSSDEVGLT
jgi:hypothetical protein